MKNTSLSFVVTALRVGTPAHAQDETRDRQDLQLGHARHTRCAVAASLHGKLVVNRAYDSTDLERDVPISPGTIFDAGSVTKQFVAAAVLLVEDGRLSLSEDVRKYIPELPDTGHKITVDHLLTHTSAVRNWTGILPLASGTPDAMTFILRQRGLTFAPGEGWSCSNSGYVLLKEVIARTSGMSFSEIHAQAPVRVARDEVDHIPRRSAGCHQEPGPPLREGGRPLEAGDAARQRWRRRPAQHRDSFQRGMMTVRFHRDQTGKVVAFGYSNPLVRDVKLTRLGDGAGSR